MSDEHSKTQTELEDGDAPDAANDAAPHATDGPTTEAAAPEEPIEAEFEPADGLLKRLTAREVSMPIALGLAAGAAVLGGVFGVVFDRNDAPTVSRAQIDAAVEAPLAEFDARLRELRQAMIERAGEGGGVAAAALNDLEAELAEVRDNLTAVQNRLRAIESAGGSGEAGAALADQLDALAAEIAETRRMAEDALAAPSAQAAELAAIDARLTSLGETARAQGRAIEQLSETSTVLAGRLTGVPAPTGLATAGAAAALAYASLQEAALSGRPFATEAADAAAYFGESEDMDALSALAETGAPTPGELAVLFRSAARAARDAERPKGGGFVDRLGRGVAGLVTVRRLDAPQTDSVGDVIVRAQRRLSNGDLAGAADELDRLDGPAGAAVEAWVEQARNRVEIERRLESLRASFTEH